MERTRTIVRIAGKDYPITGYDPEDYVRRVAIYVDRKIQEIGLATRLSVQDSAVLTAVNLADDLMKAQDENTRLRRELDETRRALEELRAQP